jgi:DNA-directed RNA polymerase subunit M/transcription elongation factor TFIIS
MISMDKLAISENKLKLVLPVEVYNGEYTQERRQIILLFCNILDSYEKFKEMDYSKQTDIVINIEKSCFKKTIESCTEEAIYIDWSNNKFKYLYSLICSRVSKNLDINSEVLDTFLIDSIISNGIDINKIGNMSSDDMSKKNEVIKEQLNNRRGQKIKQKTTSLYRCRNCGGRQCTIRTQQMRSLDEGATLILNCVTCGFRFLIGS